MSLPPPPQTQFGRRGEKGISSTKTTGRQGISVWGCGRRREEEGGGGELSALFTFPLFLPFFLAVLHFLSFFEGKIIFLPFFFALGLLSTFSRREREREEIE